MIFAQIPVGDMENFSYLVGCEETREAAVIDPGFDPEKIIAEAQKEKLLITKILLTHVHYDHSGKADALAKKTGAEIFMNPKSEQKRDKKTTRGMWIIPKKTSPVQEGDMLFIGRERAEIISAPGHQGDHLLFTIGGYLFTGDVLFIGRIGRVDLPDSNPDDVPFTLNTICDLDENLIVCPGHDYGEVKTRILREEKQKNPFLQEVLQKRYT